LWVTAGYLFDGIYTKVARVEEIPLMAIPMFVESKE